MEMTIKIHCEQSSNRKLYPLVVEKLMAAATQKLDVIAADVKEIVVADEALYGFAISEYATDGSTYTDDEWGRGLGRTIPDMSSGIFDGSIVILRSRVIDSFLPPHNEKDGIENLVRHVFFHEVGHCIDNRKRDHQHYYPSKTIHFCSLAGGCSKAVLCEYAACYFSANCLTEEQFISFTSLHVVPMLLQQSERRVCKRRELEAGQVSLANLQSEVWQSLWLELREVSKLFGYQHGKAITDLTIKDRTSDFLSPLRAAIFDDLREKLVIEWSAYPNCAPGFAEHLIQAFVQLGRVEGYAFDSELESDQFDVFSP